MAPVVCSVCRSSASMICAECVLRRLLQHRVAETALKASLKRHIERTTADTLDGPGGLHQVRDLEGKLAEKRRSLNIIKKYTELARRRNQALKLQIVNLDSHLILRRSYLLQAPHPASLSVPTPWHALALLQTRQILLREVMFAFDVHLGGRDEEDDSEDEEGLGLGARAVGAGSNGQSQGSKGQEDSVAGVVLPLPGDMQLYPPLETTAALQQTLHLLLLFSSYLALPTGLPFTPVLSPPSLLPSPHFPSLGLNPTALPLTYPQKSSKTITLSLAAVQYDVCYLAAHVGIQIPLHESSYVLRNLWRIIEEGNPPGSSGTATAGAGISFDGKIIEPVKLERIQLSLKGVVGSSSKSGVDRQLDREVRRKEKERLKREETPEEREDRRRKRRIRREERDRGKDRDKDKEDEWEVLDTGDTKEPAQPGNPVEGAHKGDG
ncbi:hypothetical protein [Phaffia rhodozyma]|uniref:Uncharacterized protein n=1 Tax=Phaffia rhodozyma TaxID=264483 RepID=A0A0F7SKB8_PHARH|nr:hypothetical protein [Phaffia rhodozyma]